jgi:ferric-dicitrate binding protein FerR (iron transport regulator)
MIMAHDWKSLVSGYLDGELDSGERAAFERRLAVDPELERELAAMRELQGLTGGMRLRELPDRIWERYWDGTYHRIERRVGWLIFSAGVMVLLAGGLYELLLGLLRDSVGIWWVRLATGALCGGLAILFVSVVRERLFMWKRDPYREVKR